MSGHSTLQLTSLLQGSLLSFSALSALYNIVEVKPLFLRERGGSYYRLVVIHVAAMYLPNEGFVQPDSLALDTITLRCDSPETNAHYHRVDHVSSVFFT